ncbi:MAG: hypothetical protein KAV87_14500, partial [Desulfobacteraceae bacterium]|nr:hypothetical protein [Desulfobacteraceae bacterium]
IEFREFAKTNNLKFEEKEVPWKKNRIAVHVLDDFCLPLQKGMPGEKEREDSNREIDKVLKEHNCDWSDYSDEGYFVPDDWIDRGNKITFRNTEGQWENVKRDWVIFEKEHPDFFEHLDKQQGGGNSS